MSDRRAHSHPLRGEIEWVAGALANATAALTDASVKNYTSGRSSAAKKLKSALLDALEGAVRLEVAIDNTEESGDGE